jgi:hypothetical protein
MSRRARRMLTLALLVGALPLLTIACPFLMLKLDVKNDMDSNQTLVEFNLSPEDDSTWGDNQLSGDVPPGAMATISHISPGDYDSSRNLHVEGIRRDRSIRSTSSVDVRYA